MRNRQHTKVHLFSRSTPTEDTNEDTPELGTIVNKKRKTHTQHFGSVAVKKTTIPTTATRMSMYADDQISPIFSAVKNYTNAHDTVSPSGQHLREVLSVLYMYVRLMWF